MPRLFRGAASATYLGLSERQERAIGLVVLEGTLGDVGCTGTMIAPGWVLTARHCAPPGDQPLRFTVLAGSGACLGAWRSARRVEHPTLDLMLLELQRGSLDPCELLEPLPLGDGSPPAVGTIAELAGLGLDEHGAHGERKFAAETVVESAPDAPDVVVDGLGRTGACIGDSGGPLLVRAGDGSVRVVGVLSSGSADCLGRDRYVRIDPDDAFFLPVPTHRCRAPDCGSVDARGRCFSGTAVWCDGEGRLQGNVCSGDDVCGWHADAAGYRCVAPESSCAGIDHFGRCRANVSEHCDSGSVISDDCGSTGGQCILDTAGRAECAGNMDP